MSDRAPVCLPVIDRVDFPAFRHVMDGEFRKSFQTWSDWLAQFNRWQNFEDHAQAMHVYVRSKDFAAWIERDGRVPNLNGLIDYAASIPETVLT